MDVAAGNKDYRLELHRRAEAAERLKLSRIAGVVWGGGGGVCGGGGGVEEGGGNGGCDEDQEDDGEEAKTGRDEEGGVEDVDSVDDVIDHDVAAPDQRQRRLSLRRDGAIRALRPMRGRRRWG